jgi:hypothetical protein
MMRRFKRGLSKGWAEDPPDSGRQAGVFERFRIADRLWAACAVLVLAVTVALIIYFMRTAPKPVEYSPKQSRLQRVVGANAQGLQPGASQTAVRALSVWVRPL